MQSSDPAQNSYLVPKIPDKTRQQRLGFAASRAAAAHQHCDEHCAREGACLARPASTHGDGHCGQRRAPGTAGLAQHTALPSEGERTFQTQKATGTSSKCHCAELSAAPPCVDSTAINTGGSYNRGIFSSKLLRKTDFRQYLL